MTRHLLIDAKYGADVHVNYPIMNFPIGCKTSRWHQLAELYDLKGGVIGIDEAQKLFDARRWASLPQSFTDKISQHRKHHLDIYTTTQDLGHIDLRVRSNVHELYRCVSLYRFPKNERVKPAFQIIQVMKKKRQHSLETERLTWYPAWKRPRLYYISKFWTKTYYDTYADVGLDKLLCKVKFEQKPGQKKGSWMIKIYDRDLVNRGKARL